MAPKSPRAMFDAIVRNLPNRTGKSLEQWTRLVKTRGPKTKAKRVEWLRSKHGLGGPTANVIAAEASGEDLLAAYDDQQALIRTMYSGKESLRAIHEKIVKSVRALGKDVELSARKTYVSASRKRQFAAIQPSTKTRVDLGLVLPGVSADGRLQSSKTVGGGRVTHRIALETPKDFDAWAKKWLKEAYKNDE